MNRDAQAGPTGIDPDDAALLMAAIAAEAGRFLAAITDRGAGRIVKSDGTPSTAADRDSERLILDRLADAFPGVPVVAEESALAHEGGLFFLVDPLDGTKDYLAGAGEYSVNIALVSGARPISAAVAAPSLGRVWGAGTTASAASLPESGAIGPWRPALVRTAPPGDLVALTSRRHGDLEGERCLDQLSVSRRLTVSSAAKFCLIASGEADVYVRCGPTMEWDTAAGDHILTRAGGCVVGPGRGPLTYGHASSGYLNGPFAALGSPDLAGRFLLPAEAVNPRRGPS